jgi:hypothetical protein
VKVAAETFRPNPAFDCFEAITQLGVGEALVSTLGAKGVPSMVERTLIRPPSSRLGPITEPERQKVMAVSPVAGQYDTDLDRDSAFEMLARRAEEAAKAEERNAAARRSRKERPESRRWTLPGYGDDDDEDERGRSSPPGARPRAGSRPGYQRQTVTEDGDQVGCAVGRNLAGPRTGAGHSGVPQEGLLTRLAKPFRLILSCIRRPDGAGAAGDGIGGPKFVRLDRRGRIKATDLANTTDPDTRAGRSP